MTPPLTGTASFLPCWTDSATLPDGDWNAETGGGRERVEGATRPVKLVPRPSPGVTGSITVTSSSLLLDSSLLDSVMYVVLAVPDTGSCFVDKLKELTTLRPALTVSPGSSVSVSFSRFSSNLGSSVSLNLSPSSNSISSVSGMVISGSLTRPTC